MSLMTNERAGRGSIQNVFVLLLLAIFAGMSTLLVVLGARVYRNTVTTAEEHNNTRIIAAMVRSAIWAEDGVSEIGTEIFDGVPILTIRSVYDDEAYVKRLYAYDGFLWESFSSEEYPFMFEAGESICPLKSFEPTIGNNVLNAMIVDMNGNCDQIRVSLKSKRK